MRRLARRRAALAAQEDGGLGIFGLLLFITMAVIGAIAVDYANLIAARTQLQAAADTAAHAALYTRERLSADEAKQAAVDRVTAAMPADRYGSVIAVDEILFGHFDPATRAFTPDPASREGVMVRTRRVRSAGNPVPSILFHLSGISDWDIARQAVFVAHRPVCMTEGFVAQGIVDIQSNNAFYNGFCIHSNTHVEVNQNNSFEEGTVVSMPDLDKLVLPASGFESNEGLQDALREDRRHIRILNRLDDVVAGTMTYGSETMPDYVTDPDVEYHHNQNKLAVSELVPNHYNVITCPSGSVTLDFDQPLRDMVVYTDCALRLQKKNGQDVVVENARIISTSTDSRAIDSNSNVRLGADDDCAPGGGAQIVSYGGVNVTSNLQAYGAQIVARTNIDFTSNADGIEGASFIAGGWIDGQSNMTMGFCNSGMEDNLSVPYYRLAL